MSTYNDIELFQAGQATEKIENDIQIRARKLEGQNIPGAYRVA